MHWARNIIGLPWTPEFNCWALMRKVFLEQDAIELPEEAAGVLILTGAAHSTGLRPAPGPGQNGDLVLMKKRDGRRHVGRLIHANGKLGVLHNDGHMATEGPVGCVGFNTLQDLTRQGMRDFEFWRRP